MAQDRGKPPVDDDLDWFTVSYRSIYLVVALVVLVAGGGGGYWWWTHRVVGPPPPPTDTAPAAPTAQFTVIEGTVKVKPVGKLEWFSADPAMALRRNDLVRTGPASAAEIRFTDGTILHVRPDSLITIEESSVDPSTQKRKVSMHITTGEVNFSTPRQAVPGSTTEFTTPTVRTNVAADSEGGLRVAEQGDSDIKIFRGSSEVRTKSGDTATLGQNQAIKVAADGKAGPKVTLPDTPVLMTPPHQAEITYGDPAQATTLLSWKAVPSAAAYHVMLDFSAYFNRPLVDRKGIRESSVELAHLDPGKYYWRVAAVDKDGVEGNFSEFYRFTVTKGAATAGPPPRLTIDSIEVRVNILQIKGSTERGAAVTVNGQSLEVQPDGSFNEFITLDKPGQQLVVIRATSLTGGTTEQKRTVVVGY